MSIHATVNPDLSVVVLCYRAGEYVRDFVAELKEELGGSGVEDYELVLVGNYWSGTDDRTPIVVQDLAGRDARIVCCVEPKKGGMGWDMRAGLNLATGNYIAVIDGDGQMPASDVTAVYAKIRKENLDVVKTFRLTRGDSFRRKMISGVYNLVFRFMFPGLNARDINSKPKIISQCAYDRMDLRSNDWFIDAEIMLEVRHHKMTFGEIPTEFLELGRRRSFISVAAVAEFLRNLILYRIREFKRPRRDN